jgi:hypothetical protein
VIIYGLCEPITGALRYVGKTSKPLQQRVRTHLKDARKKTDHKCRWIQSLVRSGLVPDAFVIEEVDGSGDEEEIHHIAQFRSIGCDLVNYAPGGRGVTAHSEETKRRIGDANRGAVVSDETRLKISTAGKGRKFSTEHRARIAAANERRWSEGKMEGARKNMSTSATTANKRRVRGADGKFTS